MKIYTYLLFAVLFNSMLTAQVAIGKTTVSNNSVLLEFGSENKGIVLPSSVSNPANAVPGTFVVNRTSQQVNFLDGMTWKNLISGGSFVPNAFLNVGSDVANGTVLGANSTTKPGVLVLESSNRAMVLPQVANPHTTIGNNASVGTIVYDSVSDSLAIFDGVNWHYWQ